MRATAELGILSPLREAGFSKQDIRDISKELGIFTWNKPSYACLASRIPYGEEITAEKLAMVEKAEQALLDMGFKEMRVRCHGKVARIEVAQSDMEKVFARRAEIAAAVKAAGFLYAALDLEGFRSGSLNAALAK
jgi:PP-loop domain protein